MVKRKILKSLTIAKRDDKKSIDFVKQGESKEITVPISELRKVRLEASKYRKELQTLIEHLEEKEAYAEEVK